MQWRIHFGFFTGKFAATPALGSRRSRAWNVKELHVDPIQGNPSGWLHILNQVLKNQDLNDPNSISRNHHLIQLIQHIQTSKSMLDVGRTNAFRY